MHLWSTSLSGAWLGWHCIVSCIFENSFSLYAGGAVFDASQYAFFGKDVGEEIELGGLEDEEDDLPAAGLDEEEFLFDREEVEFCLFSSSGFL